MMKMKIHEPGKTKEVEENEKRRKEERLRKAFGHEHSEDDIIVGIWDSVYKEGSVPKTKYSL